MSDLPKIFVSLERKINLGNYEHVNVTVGLSNIPATANESLIDLMLSGPAAYAFEKLKSELETRGYELMSQYARPDGSEVPEKLSEAAFLEHIHEQPEPGEPDDVPTMTPEEQAEFDAAREAMYMEQAAKIIGQIEAPDVTSWPEPVTLSTPGAPLAALLQRDPIPAEDELPPSHLVTFGVRVQAPPADWYELPITEIGQDGGPGQLMAVNAALSGAGYADKRGERLRHRAARAILEEAGCPIEISSIKDLSKAHAHVILSFFEHANARAIAALSQEVNL